MPNQKYSSKDSLNRMPLNGTGETVIFVNERNPTNISFTDTFSDIDMNLDLYDLESFLSDEDNDSLFNAVEIFANSSSQFFDFSESPYENYVPPFTVDLSSYFKPSYKNHLSLFSVDHSIKASFYDPWIKFKLFERSKVIDIMEKINNNSFNIMKKNQIKVFKELKVHRNYVGHKIVDNNIINATFYNLIRIQKNFYYKAKRPEGKKKKAHAYYHNSFIHRYFCFYK